jgi:hypothetical protein
MGSLKYTDHLALPTTVTVLAYRSGAKYGTTRVIVQANISVLNNIFAWFIVPLIAVGCF